MGSLNKSVIGSSHSSVFERDQDQILAPVASVNSTFAMPARGATAPSMHFIHSQFGGTCTLSTHSLEEAEAN